MKKLVTPSSVPNDQTSSRFRQTAPAKGVNRTKTAALALAAATLLAVSSAPVSAATITTFAALDALTPDTTKAANTSFSVPASPNDTNDFTFEFTFTTPTTLSASTAILDIGGSNGTSLFLTNNRLVFRSGVSGGALMLVTSNALSASTQYNVIGSLFNSPTNSGDYMRLYVNRADGVDATQANHDPDDTVNDFWGTNGGGYGVVGGGDIQVGTTVGAGNATPVGFNTTNGTLNTGVDFFYNTHVDVVPEPASLTLLGLGGMLALGRAGRRQHG